MLQVEKQNLKEISDVKRIFKNKTIIFYDIFLHIQYLKLKMLMLIKSNSYIKENHKEDKKFKA